MVDSQWEYKKWFWPLKTADMLRSIDRIWSGRGLDEINKFTREDINNMFYKAMCDVTPGMDETSLL